MVHQISSDDFEELINDKKVFLLDVREKNEFDAGHIKGANLVSSIRFDEGFEKLKVKKNDKIALYCLNGNRSDFIGKKLVENGFDRIYNLEMGVVEWLEYGKKLVK
jgi:rhodanese-related sulfurtransferase